MINKENNAAYIDNSNLHLGIRSLGWRLDYHRFRIWLKEKYSIENAYIFIGFVTKNKNLYSYLEQAGYILVFKETTYDNKGKVKGNCDSDLVLWCVRDTYERAFDKAILVSSDGDYASLVKFLHEKQKLKVVLSPTTKCSILLMKTNVPISFLNEQKLRLQAKNKRAPDTDGTV